MGNDTSLPLAPVSPGFSTMCISLQYSDSITVLHHDSGALSTIRQAIIDTWPNGVQREMAICGTGWGFKVKGNPFFTTTSSSSAQARQMIGTILQKLFSIGWQIVVSCDLARFNDRSSMFLRRSPNSFSSVHPMVCVGLSSSDKLQILNLPSQLIEPLKQTIYQSWTKGIQNESYENGVLEVKMSGNPWWATDLQSVMAKVLLQNIISTLYRYQYVYTVNVNLKSTADSLYFRFDPNVPVAAAAQFCTISLNRTDRLRVISAPDSIVNMIRGVIQATWSHGTIQEEKDHHGSWEFKISGNPWHSSKEESVMARYLVLKILQEMLAHGWQNIAAIDISRRATDKSVLIFQQREPKRCPMMCLSLTDCDKFRLINMPTALVNLFKQTLLSRWSKGIQEEKVLNLSFGSVRQIKLKGYPWNGGLNNDAYHIRSFLCNIIEAFSGHGWRVLIAGDVSAKYVHQDKGPDYPIDVHSFWFIYEPTTTQEPTAPSYGFNVPAAPYGVAMPQAPYPHVGAPSGYGVPQATATAPYPPAGQPAGYGLYPNPTEPPPSYGQATGWSDGKK